MTRQTELCEELHEAIIATLPTPVTSIWYKMATSSTYCSTFLILLLISSGSALDPVLQKAEESVTEVHDITSTPKSDNIEDDEKCK